MSEAKTERGEKDRAGCIAQSLTPYPGAQPKSTAAFPKMPTCGDKVSERVKMFGRGAAYE